ncbi:MAG: phage baseplate protein [Desulfobacteraceae bacterium]|nr:phage baseplate protein [Desulfobacteraceae bacterium]
MNPLTAAELLAVWEHSLNKSQLEKAITLLAAACPEMDAEAIIQLPIGERDAMLLQLREWMFGSRLVNTAHCPQCTEPVEWENRVADLSTPPKPDLNSSDAFHLKVSEYELHFRLPDSNDIAAALKKNDDQAARNGLLRRCILEARHADRPCDIGSLPAAVLEKLSRRMEKLDPQAEIRMELTCPSCEHQWRILFDIISFLWADINRWAENMILTIHELARKYGWSETQILELSPVRRQMYLGLIRP